MATRQYIGARYVIKVYENTQNPGSAEWQSSTSYEPLTMVTYQNSSYLSKKAVPSTIGNPASNPTYWVITGAYNGQIASLQSQIDDINSAISDLSDEIDNVGVKKYIFLGDSYGAGWTPDGDVVGWCDHVVSYLGIPASNYSIYNLGGVGFANTVNGQNFITMIQNVVISDEPEDITDIVVCGGYNDIGASVPNIISGITSFMSAAKTRFPNARVHVGFIGYSKTRSKYEIATKRNAYITGCALNGIRYLHNTEYSLYNIFNSFASDGYHPNAQGQIDIAKAVAQALITGSADVIHLYYGLEIAGKNGFSVNITPATLASDYKNGMQTLYNRATFSISHGSGYNYGLCNGNNFISVGDITNGLFLGSSFGTPSFTVPCVCQTSGSSYREMIAIISFREGEMRVALKSLNDNKNNWFNLTEMYSIMISNFQYSFDSDMM